MPPRTKNAHLDNDDGQSSATTAAATSAPAASAVASSSITMNKRLAHADFNNDYGDDEDEDEAPPSPPSHSIDEDDDADNRIFNVHIGCHHGVLTCWEDAYHHNHPYYCNALGEDAARAVFNIYYFLIIYDNSPVVDSGSL